MELYYSESLKKEKDIRFLSIRETATSWINNVGTIYEMCLELQ